MINNIIGQSKKIIKVALGINVLFLIISIFYFTKALMITLSSINIILLISFFTIEKYSALFGAMVGIKKSSSILNNALGRLNSHG